MGCWSSSGLLHHRVQQNWKLWGLWGPCVFCTTRFIISTTGGVCWDPSGFCIRKAHQKHNLSEFQCFSAPQGFLGSRTSGIYWGSVFSATQDPSEVGFVDSPCFRGYGLWALLESQWPPGCWQPWAPRQIACVIIMGELVVQKARQELD